MAVAFSISPTNLLHAEDKPRSVCEVLQTRADLNGSIVTIRGQWVVGLEQSYIKAHRCEFKLVVDGVEFPAAIDMAGASVQQKTETLRVDEESIKKVERIIREKLGDLWYLPPRQGTRPKIIVTFTGRLAAKRDLVKRYPNGTVSPNALGHLGGFAAQLVLQSAKDVEFEGAEE